ncbi:MAG: DUF2141 domain-containing protein [Novosphingobium sp.]|nr:DUF2141 domain-containing protein [Novosphingobium sp.]
MAGAMPLAAQYRQEIPNDMRQCAAGAGPAIKVTVNGVRSSSGMVRVQSYRATDADWMEKGRWIHRIEVPARAGTMTFCMPLPASGTYGIAVRHDINGNGKTDVTRDGGGMSNNPSINIFNLGKPSYKKVGVAVNQGVTPITIDMKYM